MSTTNVETPLSPTQLDLFQKVINVYHSILMADWVLSSGELVPTNHATPPSISAWPRTQLELVVHNFGTFLNTTKCEATESRITSLEEIKWGVQKYMFDAADQILKAMRDPMLMSTTYYWEEVLETGLRTHWKDFQ